MQHDQNTETAANGPEDFRYASVRERAYAKFLDVILLLPFMLGLAFVSRFISQTAYWNGAAWETVSKFGAFMAIITMSLPFIYNFIMLANGGATVGKKVLRIKVVRENRQPLGYGMAFSRSVVEGVCLSAAIGISAIVYFILNWTLTAKGNFEPEQGFPKSQFLFVPVFLLSLAPYCMALFPQANARCMIFYS